MDTINEKMTVTEDNGTSVSALAVAKIAKELETFKGGTKETAVSKFVASTLTKFCEENERFAKVVLNTPRTLSDCCAEVMDGCGNAISDIDVYRGAVQSYFPNSDIHMFMEITITGEDPTEDEINREPKKKAPVPKTPKKPKDDPEQAKKETASIPAAAASSMPVPKAKPKIETLQLSLF